MLSKGDLLRFESKVDKGRRKGGCWLWSGGTTGQGYGNFSFTTNRGKKRWAVAHRVAYVVWVGEIPKGLICCHRCDNRRCVRPDHLFIGDDQMNQSDRVAKGRGRIKAPKKYNLPQGVRRSNGKPNRFSAISSFLGKIRFLGVFDSPEEASAAYQDFVRKNHSPIVRSTSPSKNKFRLSTIREL